MSTCTTPHIASPGSLPAIRIGDSLSLFGTLKACDGTYDLAGASISAVLRPLAARPTLPEPTGTIDLVTEVLDVSAGKIKISAAPTATATWDAGRYRLLVRLTTADAAITSNGTLIEVKA